MSSLTLIERLHDAVTQAVQATLVDGERSHVVLAFDPRAVDADVWAALQEDARHDPALRDRLEDLWDEQIGDEDQDVAREAPAPLVLLAGTRATPTTLAEGLWRGPQLHALEEEARDVVATRLTGKPLDPLHTVKAGARWAQSAVEGPLSMIATTLGHKVGRAAQEAPHRAREAWQAFLRDVDRDRR